MHKTKKKLDKVESVVVMDKFTISQLTREIKVRGTSTPGPTGHGQGWHHGGGGVVPWLSLLWDTRWDEGVLSTHVKRKSVRS